MLKQLVLLVGLASSLVNAAPSYGSVVIVNTEESAATSQQPETRTGSTSDNSCWVKELPNRAPIFRHPQPDLCVQIEPLRQLKIYHTAICSNGTEALLARYDVPGCIGEPSSLETVSEDLLKTCLSMPSKGAGSYAFWCEGAAEAPPQKQPSSDPSKPNNNGGSIWGLLGILLLIFATMLLVAVIKLVSFIQRATNAGNKFLGIFGQRDGAIALN
ncbi:hypothetical protein BKA67DRAFT_663962 [Truncatella angustata]|uniref:Uncharacterized protein n=1 Tax=Truncatella angustata TaxID=152316 RepID=A0A9P8RHG7_9PEZI|nr:uncharacterized protein BKA67DRAFT_663962 [Truncatella angustata]KAH6646098.1 hypothetical protein BKA67DRAFT_663962 [Truncatella angustata]